MVDGLSIYWDFHTQPSLGFTENCHYGSEPLRNVFGFVPLQIHQTHSWTPCSLPTEPTGLLPIL